MHVGPCAEGGSGRARLVGMDTSSSSWLCLTVGTVRYYLYILFFPLWTRMYIIAPVFQTHRIYVSNSHISYTTET